MRSSKVTSKGIFWRGRAFINFDKSIKTDVWVAFFLEHIRATMSLLRNKKWIGFGVPKCKNPLIKASYETSGYDEVGVLPFAPIFKPDS